MWSFCDLQQARVQEVSSTVHHHGVDIVIRNVPLIEMCGCGFLDSVTRHHRIIAEQAQGRSLCLVLVIYATNTRFASARGSAKCVRYQ